MTTVIVMMLFIVILLLLLVFGATHVITTLCRSFATIVRSFRK